MKKKVKRIPSVLLISMILFLAPVVHADIYDNLKILKISPQDERAVVRMDGGQEKEIKHGDAVGEAGKVTEISVGRVVIEESTQRGVETIIIRIEAGTQKTERISRQPERQPVFYRPQ